MLGTDVEDATEEICIVLSVWTRLMKVTSAR